VTLPLRADRLLQRMIALTRKHPYESVERDWALPWSADHPAIGCCDARSGSQRLGLPAQTPLIQWDDIIREPSEHRGDRGNCMNPEPERKLRQLRLSGTAEAEATGSRKELIDHFCKVDLLEELGMKYCHPQHPRDLAEMIVRRYEKGAIIMATNGPLEDWAQVLLDTAAAGAILDRVVHHARIIGLQGGRHRMHSRSEPRHKQAEEALTRQTR